MTIEFNCESGCVRRDYACLGVDRRLLGVVARVLRTGRANLKFDAGRSLIARRARWWESTR